MDLKISPQSKKNSEPKGWFLLKKIQLAEEFWINSTQMEHIPDVYLVSMQGKLLHVNEVI